MTDTIESLKDEISALTSILRKRNAIVLSYHRITSKGLGANPLSSAELRELNLINAAVRADIKTQEWEI